MEAVDVNGTRDLEKLPDNFHGKFGWVFSRCLKFFLLSTFTGYWSFNLQRVTYCVSYTVCDIACSLSKCLKVFLFNLRNAFQY